MTLACYEGRFPDECGGCQGLGAHSPRCRTRPGFIWKILADKAEGLGDTIGANDYEAANTAYGLAGRFKKRWEEARDLADAD